MALAVTAVDNANGTVTFTVTGATGTVTIYTAPWSGGQLAAGMELSTLLWLRAFIGFMESTRRLFRTWVASGLRTEPTLLPLKYAMRWLPSSKP